MDSNNIIAHMAIPAITSISALALAGNYIALKTSDGATRIAESVSALENSLAPNVITEDVIGGHEPERFYIINGQRAYLEIDGMPVDSYLDRR